MAEADPDGGDEGSKSAVWAALIGNVLVATTKAGAAAFTGSSAMLSEAVHSFVDTGNEVLLLYGMRVARKKADRDHPAGYGRELYFWSFIVALLVFALGAGVSIVQGVHRVLNPQPIENAIVSEIVLAASFLFEGWSWVVSVRQFRKAKGDLGWWRAFVKSKDPPLFMVVFEDSAALIGIAIAAIGVVLAAHFDMPLADGISSILIGLVLACTSTLLLRESKSLLIGERADGELIRSLLDIANGACGSSHANGVLTVHLAPDQIMAAMSFEFDDALTAPQIEQMIGDIERRIQEAHPEVTSLFIKPQNPLQYTRTVRERYGDNVADATRDQTPVAG
ncbi:cation diffusion facilitator family transporter [Scleromatobacter humisilvae]|uniref:Cation diffusion facilitator family transporter n=1 Tax=Scleromatobacter humisilvae TaxID=2897159 RepID=A0A9X1YJJ6_9BURK|nr:cation diffusion facilitator family transporter [Scleromatobacter humisilvae]MCK9685552.1 cation diffusion facilitator family transporter [Scleromatobacter humisilvae]